MTQSLVVQLFEILNYCYIFLNTIELYVDSHYLIKYLINKMLEFYKSFYCTKLFSISVIDFMPTEVLIRISKMRNI
jgi:hypothetical protein